MNVFCVVFGVCKPSQNSRRRARNKRVHLDVWVEAVEGRAEFEQAVSKREVHSVALKKPIDLGRPLQHHRYRVCATVNHPALEI